MLLVIHMVLTLQCNLIEGTVPGYKVATWRRLPTPGSLFGRTNTRCTKNSLVRWQLPPSSHPIQRHSVIYGPIVYSGAQLSCSMPACSHVQLGPVSSLVARCQSMCPRFNLHCKPGYIGADVRQLFYSVP